MIPLPLGLVVDRKNAALIANALRTHLQVRGIAMTDDIRYLQADLDAYVKGSLHRSSVPLTTAQVADLLKVSPSRIRQLAVRLQGVKGPHGWIFDRDVIAQYKKDRLRY